MVVMVVPAPTHPVGAAVQAGSKLGGRLLQPGEGGGGAHTKHVCARACVRVCVCACVHACVYACERVCVHARGSGSGLDILGQRG